jgi:DNA uptake protein ComE-like DNA-binding protein
MMHNDSRVFMNEAEAEELIALSMIGEYVAEAR